jgi:tRNA A37 threonylcarbamoyladenosine synthetase subunit TsaC/SUA5/YrdC
VSVVLPLPSNLSVLKNWHYLHRGSGTLAFRLPRPTALRALLKATGPLAAPSANPAGQPPATTIKEARAYFGLKVAVYADGNAHSGSPSTLVHLAADGALTLLRPGATKIKADKVQ